MLTESVAIVPGFTSYFAFSRLRSGYSGVATFCRSSATPAQSDSSLAQASMVVKYGKLVSQQNPGILNTLF